MVSQYMLEVPIHSLFCPSFRLYEIEEEEHGFRQSMVDAKMIGLLCDLVDYASGIDCSVTATIVER